MKKEDNDSLLSVATEDFINRIQAGHGDLNVNRYVLPIAVAKRTRQLVDEKLERRLAGESPAVLYKNFHPVSEAAEEFFNGNVRIVEEGEQAHDK